MYYEFRAIERAGGVIGFDDAESTYTVSLAY